MRARPSSSLAAQVLTEAAASPPPAPETGASSPTERTGRPLSRRERRAAARGRAAAGTTGSEGLDTGVPPAVQQAAQPAAQHGLPPRNVSQPRQYSMRRH
jgi:hypothetical protein